MNCDWAVIGGDGCNQSSYSSIFIFFFRKGLVIPQHIVVISILFIAMQDLVGEDKQLEYDLAGDQQNSEEDGPREGGEMTLAAALW